MFDVMQGDQYSIHIGIHDHKGIPINPTGVEDVEITVGNITKKYSTEEVFYAYGKWVFPLYEDESNSFYDEDLTVKVKIKTKKGEIVNRRIGEITMIDDD